MPHLISRWLKPQPLLLAAHGLWDLGDETQGKPHADFAAWCRAHGQPQPNPPLLRRRPCTLWLGSSLLTDLVCEAGAPLQSPTLRTAWAQRVLGHYHGDAAAAWALLPWRLQGALGVSALQGADLPALRVSAATHGVHLAAVRPLWPLLLQRVLARRPALRRAPVARALLVEAAAEGAVLTMVSLSAGRVTALSRRRWQPATAERWQSLLQEDALARACPAAALFMGVPALPGLAVDVVEAAPIPQRAGWPRTPSAVADFLRPRARVGPLAWVWLGTALLVLAVAAVDAFSAWQARAQAFAVALPAVTRARTPQAPAGVTHSPADAALAARLAHPWRDVFLATEAPAAAGLVWLSIEHAPGAELRLQGLAAEAETVHRVAATLRSRPAWRQVLVSRLETQAPGQGQAFEIAARLAGAAP